MGSKALALIVISSLSFVFSGCWVAAGAVGAEAGYIASQEERTTGETIDDQLLLTKVKTTLLADDEVSGLNINVDVFKKVVTLRGYVKTQEEIEKAIQLASAVHGVKEVDSRLVLDR